MIQLTILGALLALVTTVPLAWKWQLGVRRTAMSVAALAIVFGPLVSYVGRGMGLSILLEAASVWFLILITALATLGYCFFRDPEREPPEGEDVLVSPADGTVTYVRTSHDGVLPVSSKHGRNYALDELTKTPLEIEEAVVVGIGMSFLDVHVNRAPFTGQIALQRRYPGRFGSLRRTEMVFENERVTTLLERGTLQVAIVQIASRLVRRIVSYVSPGDTVALGQRIGMIRFGSQVDLVLPARPDIEVNVTEGQRLRAGESIIAVIKQLENQVSKPLSREERRPALTATNQTAAGRATRDREPFSIRAPDRSLPGNDASVALEGSARLSLGESMTGAARVIELDPYTDARWEAFVNAHPDALVYHHPLWSQVIERGYGHQSVCLACETNEGQLRGVLPLFRTRGLLSGGLLSSLPHTPVTGPLALDSSARDALIAAAVHRVRVSPGMRLQLRTPAALPGAPPADVVGIPARMTYVLQLPEPGGKVRFGNSRNCARIKWALSKAERSGVAVRTAETTDELRAWYKLYLDAMRWHAVPPRPYRFFEAAWDLLRPRGLMRLLVAERHEGNRCTLIAGSIFLLFGRTVFYAFNGRRRDSFALRPNDVIQWRAIQDAHQDGFRYYDFGEVDEGQVGLSEFKSKWGAEPRRLYRYYYPAPRGADLALLSSSGPVRRLANAVWRQLPLRATARLGDWIYEYF